MTSRMEGNGREYVAVRKGILVLGPWWDSVPRESRGTDGADEKMGALLEEGCPLSLTLWLSAR